MLITPRAALVLLASVVALTSAPAAQARRSSGIRDTTYCRSDGCFNRDPSSGFYRRKLNADGGIARSYDRSSSRGHRSRY